MKFSKEQILGGLWGLIVGDALGVPVEFTDREILKKTPVETMIGYGTYNQPPGTWSDDSSLMLCTVEGLLEGYNLTKIADLFVKWYSQAYWTPYGEVFDVGNTTRRAIRNLINGLPYNTAGLTDYNTAGNGSIMRILPIVFTLDGIDEEEKFKKVKELSSITHANILCIISCYIYVEAFSIANSFNFQNFSVYNILITCTIYLSKCIGLSFNFLQLQKTV